MNKPYEKVLTTRGWAVLEKPTNQLITVYRTDNGSRAKIRANFLNGGNGFNGWTPEFILRGAQ